MSTGWTASEWLDHHAESVYEIISGNITWPFTNVSKSYIHLVNYVYTSPIWQSYPYYGAIINVIGIVLSVCSICVVWREAFKEKNSFYVSMLVISVFDLFFNICCLLLRLVRDPIRDGSNNYSLMVVMSYCRGVTYVCSLASDLCVMALTIERYVALCKPIFYRNLSEDKKNKIRLIVFMGVCVLSTCRIHYALDRTVVYRDQMYQYIWSEFTDTPFYTGLYTFSDIVLPFVLLSMILILSMLVILEIVKKARARRKLMPTFVNKRANKNGKNQIPQPPHEVAQIAQAAAIADGISEIPLEPVPGNVINEVPRLPVANQANLTSGTSQTNGPDGYTNTVSLILVLDFLFITNQISYCLFNIRNFIRATGKSLTYDCTIDQFEHWCNIMWIFWAVTFQNGFVECLSHAVNFVFYFTFSQGFRKEWVLFVKMLASKVGC